MGILGKIFTWWDGATVGTLLNSWSTGKKVGEDSLGNRYFRAKKGGRRRSEEHTSELQSLMRISYAVFCLKKKILTTSINNVRIPSIRTPTTPICQSARYHMTLTTSMLAEYII